MTLESIKINAYFSIASLDCMLVTLRKRESKLSKELNKFAEVIEQMESARSNLARISAKAEACKELGITLEITPMEKKVYRTYKDNEST